MNRRTFLALPIGFLFSPADLTTIERSRVLRAADRYLREAPVTVTASSSPRSAGGPHDYFSEGDYWWPDPSNPAGPYIQRDGMSNPGNFNDHRLALIGLSLRVPALTAARMVTRDRRYRGSCGPSSSRMVSRHGDGLRDPDDAARRPVGLSAA